MKKFLLVLLAMVLLSFPVNSTVGEPKGFLGKAFSSTVALYGTDNKDHFDCTASIYDQVPNKLHNDYLIISAGHCVQEVPNGVTFSIADNIGGKLVPVKLLKVREDGNMDFAQFELVTDKTYPVIGLGDENTLKVGDAVINVNFADGIGKQLSTGRVSTQGLIPTRDCPEECRDGFLVQVDGAGGSSGSAIISKKTHKIVGLVVWGFDVNVGLGVEPISRFQTFLQMPTQEHPVTALDEMTIIIQKSISISEEVFKDFFGQSHPFTLTVHGPDPVFIQNGYTFKVDAEGFELSDEYYYNVPVYIDKSDEGYVLTSTKDGVSVPVYVTAAPTK